MCSEVSGPEGNPAGATPEVSREGSHHLHPTPSRGKATTHLHPPLPPGPPEATPHNIHLYYQACQKGFPPYPPRKNKKHNTTQKKHANKTHNTKKHKTETQQKPTQQSKNTPQPNTKTNTPKQNTEHANNATHMQTYANCRTCVTCAVFFPAILSHVECAMVSL